MNKEETNISSEGEALTVTCSGGVDYHRGKFFNKFKYIFYSFKCLIHTECISKLRQKYRFASTGVSLPRQ